ncbi:protein CEPU-1-like [Dermacentor variabilis]|uniref:protein CEPU-1-like n=1 Tax=Dermacentor variabilis TaxID=34621 RepID=UPI003F5C0AAE
MLLPLQAFVTTLLITVWLVFTSAWEQGTPKLQSAGFPDEVSLGEEIVATCSVKKGSTGPYTLTWLKGGAPLESSGHVTVSFTASASSLSIGGVRVEDVGNYTCKAANAFGSDTLTLPLLIAGSPKLHSAGFSAGLTLGEDTVATCTVKKGSPGPFLLSWHKDGLEIGGGAGRVSVATKATSTMLSIDAIRVEDIGNYSCVARNAFGSESLTLPLTISA